MATRSGRGGQPGKPRPPGLVKFVVEFDGGRLGKLPRGQAPEPKISASRGEISRGLAEPVPGSRRWRSVFELEAAGDDPDRLGPFLAPARQPLGETRLCQYPPANGPRN